VRHFLSPTGDWLLLSGRFGDASLRLFNLEDGGVVDIIQDFQWAFRPAISKRPTTKLCMVA